MNEKRPFQISLIRKYLFSDQFDLAVFLDQLPLPCLLLDPTNRAILYTNPVLSKVVDVARDELLKFDLPRLVDLTSSSLKNEGFKPGSYSVYLKIRVSDPIQATMSVITIPDQKNWLCLFHGSPGFHNGILEGDEQQGLVQKLIHIMSSTSTNPVHELLREAVQATGTQNVGLYLADERTPAFNIVEAVGEISLLPSHIPTRDVPMLKKILIWSPGNRTLPLSSIILSARSKKLSFLASFPIGSADAIIGFLVFTNQSAILPTDIPIVGSIFTAFINLAIAHGSVIEELKDCLAFTQEKLHSLSITADHIQEGLITISPDLSIKGMNPAAEAIFGYSSQEAIDQPVEHILIGSETLSSHFESAQKGENSQHKEHLRLFRRNGEDFLAHLRFLPVKKEEKLIAIVILVDDLSEKEKIRIQTEQLEQRAFLGEVTAIFAHEVRNPINNISTGLQLMARTLPADDPNQVEITRLEQDCDRLVELMKSILSLSKPTDYHMISVDVGQLIQRILDRRINRLQNSRIFLDLQVSPETPPVTGDPRALEQVFNNLINNALQAMGEAGGNLVVKIHLVDQTPEVPEFIDAQPMVQISIADTGPGIPKEIQDRIFQPFFSTRSGGTGLGLAIAKRIVTFHTGNIRLESFPGGTIFYVTLPVERKTIKHKQRVQTIIS